MHAYVHTYIHMYIHIDVKMITEKFTPLTSAQYSTGTGVNSVNVENTVQVWPAQQSF